MATTRAAARLGTTGQGRSRAQDIDRHIGRRLRERRMVLGLSQQQTAKLIGVTYQQAHKYETGVNRVTAGRLFALAQALGVEVGYFFEGFGQDTVVKPTRQQRLLLDLARNFINTPNRKHQEAVCSLARALAHPEPALARDAAAEPGHGPGA
jgi:transcriptional regulator with XRE-family HTH domain